jgi:type I restriction enzyme S subunit
MNLRNDSWIQTTLGDFISLQRGHDLTQEERQEGHVPVMGAAGQNGFHNKAIASGPGIVVGRSGGSFGQVHFVNEDYWPHNTALYVTDFKGNDPYFVYYLLNLLDFSSLNSGSAQPSLNRNYLYPISINVPNPSEQQRISKVLFDLDSKIELNNKINAELEAMAKLIYNYWFVQFDFPNTKGKPYKSSGGKMVWSEDLKKHTPMEWQITKVGDLLYTSLGGTPSTKEKKYWDGGTIAWLNSGEIANFPIINSELRITEAAIKSSATELLPKGSVMLSITRHLRPSILGIDACANQSVVGIKEKGDIKYFFLYPYLQNEIPRLMTLRSGAQQPHINKEIVDESFMLIPSEASGILKLYNEQVGNLYDLIISNAFQNQKLSELRDWLLPMLMNGQVKVGEAEEELAMAAEPEVRYNAKKRRS